MTLIEMVRKARKHNCGWISVDEDCMAFAYDTKPYKEADKWNNLYNTSYEKLGIFNLTCNWKDSLIDITKLRGIK